MHHVTFWAVVAAMALLSGCVDLIGPMPPSRDPSSSGGLRVPKPPVTFPDSVSVPPMPLPPIYEELPQVIMPP